MTVYSIWESHHSPANAERGFAVAKAIWDDMPGFDGYLSHELIRDVDDPGHVLVVSRWSSREAADTTLVRYADNPKVTEANRLVARPRRRFIGELGGS